MTTRRKLTVAAAAVAAALAFTAYQSAPSEPSYAGHTLSEWLQFQREETAHPEKLLPSPTPTEAIRRIGTNAIPYLLRWITEHDTPTTKERTVEWAEAHLPYFLIPPVVTNWANPAPRINRANAALNGFLILGPKAASALPELERLASSPTRFKVALAAVFSLVYIRPESLPALERIAQSTNEPACSIARTYTNYTRR